ncbi:MAG: preprotein translocase subunit SecE [Clostridia bacterium]|nr:preprotein translocase subunit SecE [Clostridia bacterium]
MAKDQNSEAAKKVADAEKASKKKSAKNDGKPNIFVRAAKAVAKFFKDLKGENKKIVWPSAKTVLKNTGIVLAVVLIVGAAIWLIDFGLSEGMNALLGIEIGATEATTGEAATTVASAVATTVPSTTAATTVATTVAEATSAVAQ